MIPKNIRIRAVLPGVGERTHIGAPVKYKGVEIGSVADIRLQLEEVEVDWIPVLIEIDANKIAGRGFKETC